jgi:8-oxo-dGTP diphosphatase
VHGPLAVFEEMKRDYPDRPIVGVGAVIVEHSAKERSKEPPNERAEGPRVVLIRRVAAPMAGEWSVPGGVLEVGETLRQGTEREALEETGLVVIAGDVLDVFDAIYTDPGGRIQYHFVLIDFLCQPVSGELRAGGDATEVRWIAEADLVVLPVTASIAGVIRKGLQRVSN